MASTRYIPINLFHDVKIKKMSTDPKAMHTTELSSDGNYLFNQVYHSSSSSSNANENGENL